MSELRTQSAPPRLAVRMEEAAACLGISDDHFRAHVAPHLRIVRLGRAKLVALTELQRFLDDHGERVLETGGRR
jgi:hypothetical protein